LKLYKIVRGRSLFSRPQMGVSSDLGPSSIRSTGILKGLSFFDLLPAIRLLVDHFQSTLGDFLSDDLSSVSRSASMREVRTAGSL
jgi:hypothetical protein